MTLCQKTKFDQKNRILIPKEYIKSAGGADNCKCYVQYQEGTDFIIIRIGDDTITDKLNLKEIKKNV